MRGSYSWLCLSPPTILNATSNSHRPRFNAGSRRSASPINGGRPRHLRFSGYLESQEESFTLHSFVLGSQIESGTGQSETEKSQHGEVVAGGGGGGVVVRRVGGGAGAAGAEPAADQVPGGLGEADGLHGLRDRARRDAIVDVLLRRRDHADVAPRVPVLHHPAGAQRPERGAVARAPLRPPPRAPRSLQARQRQRHALHQPAAPDPELAGLRSLRQRLQDHPVD